MKLFYHHVGKKGAEEDFKKTVFARVPISLVERSIPNDDPDKPLLLSELYEKFPIGSFNCWGVPSGAASVIKNLSFGDAVLLVETTSENGGYIPALCVVKVFIRHEFPQLSYALWENSHFPYIFFFETEALDFLWSEFINDLDYASNFDPRGKFYSVSQERLRKVGGAETYVEKIRQKAKKITSLEYIANEYLRNSIREQTPEYQDNVIDEINNILKISNSNSLSLTDESQEPLSTTTSLPRDTAFSNLIKLLYGERCAVCGSNRRAPIGNPEVECAHIYPKSKKGSDVIQNGISLCKLHHWAFDCGWFSILDDLTIVLRPDIPRTIHYTFITDFEGKKISVPKNSKYHPHPLFLSAHRKIHGFDEQQNSV